jgi:hypothetical protein
MRQTTKRDHYFDRLNEMSPFSRLPYPDDEEQHSSLHGQESKAILRGTETRAASFCTLVVANRAESKQDHVVVKSTVAE